MAGAASCHRQTLSFLGQLRPVRLKRAAAFLKATVPGPAVTRYTVQGPSFTAHASQRQPATATLPNGLSVAYFNKAELDLFYDEIIGQCSYLSHGVHLMPGNTVIDIGANVGLFSLVASQAVGPEGVVVSVEPLAEARHAAQLNAASLQEWCQGRCCMPLFVGAAVGAEPREAVEMTTYHWALGWSTLNPNNGEVRYNMRAYLDQLLGSPHPEGAAAQQDGPASSSERRASPEDSMLEQNMLVRAGRLLRKLPLASALSKALEALVVELMLRSQRTVTVPQTSVSDLIREHGLQRVNLLKVDAERAELDVLRGIKQEDWHKICQLSLEVHDIVGDEDVSCGTSRVEMLVHMLNRQGFRHVVTEQSPRMRGTNLYMMYATR